MILLHSQIPTCYNQFIFSRPWWPWFGLSLVSLCVCV